MTKDLTQAADLPINNFHLLSDISRGRNTTISPPKKEPTTWECMCCYQKYVNKAALLAKAPNGINERNQCSHVCSINSVIIGSCESVFISIHRTIWLSRQTRTKNYSCICFLSPWFPPPPPLLWIYGQCQHTRKRRKKDEEAGITCGLWLWAPVSLGVNQSIFLGDGSSRRGAPAVMSLFIILQPVSVIGNWLRVSSLAMCGWPASVCQRSSGGCRASFHLSSVRTVERVVLVVVRVCCWSLVALSVTGLGVITVHYRSLFVYLVVGQYPQNLDFKAEDWVQCCCFY